MLLFVDPHLFVFFLMFRSEDDAANQNPEMPPIRVQAAVTVAKLSQAHRSFRFSGQTGNPWVGKDKYRAATHKLPLNRAFAVTVRPPVHRGTPMPLVVAPVSANAVSGFN
jgi:hypothetical protein